MKVLIVDENEQAVETIGRVFKRPLLRLYVENVTIRSAVATAVRDGVELESADLIVGDPPVGVAVDAWLSYVRERYPLPYVIVQTKPSEGKRLLSGGVRADRKCMVLTKPYHTDELAEVIECAVLQAAEVIDALKDGRHWQ